MLKALTYSLCKNLNDLCSLVKNAPVLEAMACVIPPVPFGMADNQPNRISPSTVVGREVVRHAVTCWKDLLIVPEYSQKCARRTAGFIRLGKNQNQIVECVNTINDEKNKIKALVTALPKGDRFRTLRSSFAGVMALHLYRNIQLFDEADIAVMGFSWGNKALIHKPDPRKLCDRINELAKGNAALSDLAERISACPPSELRVRRTLKPQPVSNIRFENGKKLCVTAPMPFIVLQDTPFQHNPLPLYDAEHERQTRTDKSKTILLGRFRGEDIVRVRTSNSRNQK
ncbi:DNA replication terminus site-binding protein [Xenorhabdus sp. TH1]|uniref:DNA replication terminus site-binding protein n=1 Tax=Xenorhabdus sp. TH1 TaxID=3130166 RepID=UPI0030D4D7A7